MKTSRGAYKMMKMLLGWIDSQYRFDISDKRKALLDGTVRDRRRFEYLKNAGYICELDPGRFEVTDEAKIGLLGELVKQRRPDGKTRLVMFDIPEKLKANRNYLRTHLVELGFEMCQKSVWFSRLPCEDLIKLVAKYHGLSKYIDLFVGTSIPIR
ncbi:MAG: CRISPR-associated endonuclease Cas2 [bacterium]